MSRLSSGGRGQPDMPEKHGLWKQIDLMLNPSLFFFNHLWNPGQVTEPHLKNGENTLQ